MFGVFLDNWCASSDQLIVDQNVLEKCEGFTDVEDSTNCVYDPPRVHLLGPPLVAPD